MASTPRDRRGLKILHLSFVRELSAGQEKQLLAEVEASRSLEDVSWHTVAFHNGESLHGFVKKNPMIFRPMILRHFFAWITILKQSKQYDFVLVRHMPFDPVSIIFAPFIKNRVSIHHSLELQELPLIQSGWRGRFAASIERFVGYYCLRAAVGIMGVTDEIAQYQKNRAQLCREVCAFPNGVIYDQIPVLDDLRGVNRELHAGFVCGKFSPWHGLEKLMDLASDVATISEKVVLVVHLVGNVSHEQRQRISLLSTGSLRFIEHGVLSESEYRPILAMCDFGLTSLALELKGLREASTLKVREMLAMGLPVYSGHADIALDERRPFVRISQSPSFTDLVEFGLQCRLLKRDYVRQGSASLVDKTESLIRAVEYLQKLQAGH